MSDIETNSSRSNPSRAKCEEIIRRILMTEVLEKGTNEHFKTAADFLKYFQSLYPASDSLTKQVQRAVKALNMPKDERGYYIINKTAAQLDQDKELSFILKKTSSRVVDLSDYETLFLKVEPAYKEYLFQLLSESESLKDKVITMINSSSGIIFYTSNKQQLEVLLNSLINR
ncbi:MAG: hypothetical protein HUJ71_07545 [Pseudobutyrivibrio sp.]|nr:hypothetical protein [Pseudobutyrivibrio sp.]